MKDLVLFSGWVVRGVAAWLLVLASVFLAIAFLGVGNATTDASAAQLYIMAGTYLALSWAALAYCLLGSREWLRWALLLVPFFPALLVLGLYAASSLMGS